MSNAVVLSVNPSFEHVRVARHTAVAVAQGLPFEPEAIDDVRVAVDELSSALIEAGAASMIHFEFGHVRGVFVAEGSATVRTPPQLNEIALQLLGTVVDGFELSETEGQAHFRATKRA